MSKTRFPVGKVVTLFKGNEDVSGTVVGNKFGRLDVLQPDGETVVHLTRAEVEANFARVDQGFVQPAQLDPPSNAFVIEDEWYGQIERGDPFEEAAVPYKEANPDKHFRWLGKKHIERRGMRDYQPVKAPDGKPLEVRGMPLGFIPNDVHKERQRRIRERTDKDTKTRLEETHAEMARIADASGGTAAVLSPAELNKVRNEGIESGYFVKQ